MVVATDDAVSMSQCTAKNHGVRQFSAIIYGCFSSILLDVALDLYSERNSVHNLAPSNMYLVTGRLSDYISILPARPYSRPFEDSREQTKAQACSLKRTSSETVRYEV
jgi:hypothetical protein